VRFLARLCASKKSMKSYERYLRAVSLEKLRAGAVRFTAVVTNAVQVNCTLGALRSVASSILNSSAGENPNMPENSTLGKVSLAVL